MKRERDVAINFADLQPVTPVPFMNLPDLVEEACYEPKDGAPYMVLECKPATRAGQVCPCGNSVVSIHGKLAERRLVHDVNIGVTQVDLLVDVPRYRCEKCGGTFSHKYDSIIERKQMTRRLYEQIRRDVFVRPFSDVSNDFGYSDTTIATIFEEYAAELDAQRGPVVAPRVLGIDEKHIVHAMRAVFVDSENGTLLEMKATNKKADIIGTIEAMVDYDKNIKLVTMDMSPAYRSYVRECLPYAKIIVDKYHIYQDLGVKVKKTRTRILEFLKDQIKAIQDPLEQSKMNDVYNMVASDSYLFKYGPEKLAEKPNRLSTLADVCRTFPEFNHLRLLKEGFELIYDCSDRAAAEGVFAAWEELVPPAGVRQMAEWRKKYDVPPDLYSEFRVLKRTINNWREEVFGYFEAGSQVTNAVAEGINNMIERFNRLGNGYSFEHLRAKALYWHLAAPRVRYTLKYRTKQAPKRAAMYKDTASFFSYAVPDAALFGMSDFTMPDIPEKIPYLKMEEVSVPRTPLSAFHYLPKRNATDR